MPAGLLVHEPGVSGPDEHVEEAEHLAGQHRGRFIKEERGKVRLIATFREYSGLETETNTLSECGCSQSRDNLSDS